MLLRNRLLKLEVNLTYAEPEESMARDYCNLGTLYKLQGKTILLMSIELLKQILDSPQLQKLGQMCSNRLAYCYR